MIDDINLKTFHFFICSDGFWDFDYDSCFPDILVASAFFALFKSNSNFSESSSTLLISFWIVEPVELLVLEEMGPESDFFDSTEGLLVLVLAFARFPDCDLAEEISLSVCGEMVLPVLVLAPDSLV